MKIGMSDRIFFWMFDHFGFTATLFLVLVGFAVFVVGIAKLVQGLCE